MNSRARGVAKGVLLTLCLGVPFGAVLLIAQRAVYIGIASRLLALENACLSYRSAIDRLGSDADLLHDALGYYALSRNEHTQYLCKALMDWVPCNGALSGGSSDVKDQQLIQEFLTNFSDPSLWVPATLGKNSLSSNDDESKLKELCAARRLRLALLKACYDSEVSSRAFERMLHKEFDVSEDNMQEFDPSEDYIAVFVARMAVRFSKSGYPDLGEMLDAMNDERRRMAIDYVVWERDR